MSIVRYKSFCILLFLLVACCSDAKVVSPQSSFTVMLAPAGDARTTGRVIDKNFERWIAWEYARAVKEQLEREMPGVTVVLSRGPGEVIYPLQSANFANRLRADLFVSINFYQENEARPRCTIYQFSYGNDFVTLSHELAFHSYDRAHLFNKERTARAVDTMRSLFTRKEYEQQFAVHGIYRMPFAPLIGVVSPAIGIEMGIKNADGWRAYLDPLVRGIKELVGSLG